jgi:NCS2 family nucleobase:cation symporter-2
LPKFDAWGGLFDRRNDKPLQRPADMVHALDDTPPLADIAALTLQQLAIQSIYFLLPGIVASTFGAGPLATTQFLCLSILCVGFAGLLQAQHRGPLGSGYALPFIPSPVFVAVYLLAAEHDSAAGASAMVVASGIIGMLVALLLRRLSHLVPTEVAGVVVFLIGVSLLPRALAAAMPASLPPDRHHLAGLVALGTLAVMILVALTRGRLARFGALIGALAGLALALPLGLAPPDAAETLATLPWLALPLPQLPDFGGFDLPLLPAFLTACCASVASWLGDMVAFQRAADRDWKRPDEPPLRRGVLAGFGAITLAGLLGGMAPGTSSACVGLAIASRSLARIIAVAGGITLLLLACSPRLVGLFVLVPDPVKAALLGYVCCFMLAAGCQLLTLRMLDARRTFVIGLGLAGGLAVLIAPGLAGSILPSAMTSPVTAGAAIAALLNLATAPFVRRQARFTLALDGRMTQAIEDRCEALGGAWGTKRATMDKLSHCLMELGEVLAGRGLREIAVEARSDGEQVTVLVRHAGPPLPAPSARPAAADLEGGEAAQEAFALWLATRQSSRVARRLHAGLQELRVEFAD